MDKCEVKLMLQKLVDEDGYGNPLYLSTDDMGDKYKQALRIAVEWMDGYVEKDGKLHVNVEYLKWLLEETAKFNRAKLEEVVLYEDGKPLDIPAERINRFRFIGLSNICFVEIAIYKEELESDPFFDNL